MEYCNLVNWLCSGENYRAGQAEILTACRAILPLSKERPRSSKRDNFVTFYLSDPRRGRI
jgi:hypothetical protein